MQRDLVVRHEENCVHDVFSVQVSAIASNLVWQKWSDNDVDGFYVCKMNFMHGVLNDSRFSNPPQLKNT